MVPYIEDGVELQKAAAEAGKKNVFLIGDSLRMGYCETVKTDLSDVANVFYPAENCRNSQYIITCLRTWSTLCDPKTVDLVHFNCGHWDAAHWNGAPVSLTPLPVYGENLRALVWQLRHIFPNAAVTFATSTPMSPNAVQGVNPRSNEELRAYNETARSPPGLERPHRRPFLGSGALGRFPLCRLLPPDPRSLRRAWSRRFSLPPQPPVKKTGGANYERSLL